MPGDHCFWSDQNESIGPTRIPAAECDPEELVERIKPGVRLLAFEHGELLAQGNGLQRKPVARQNECTNVRHHWNEQAHRSDNSVPCRDRGKQAKCFSLADQVLMTHTQQFCKLGSHGWRGFD